MSKYTYELRECIDTFGREEVKGWFSDYELSDFLSQSQIDVINERGVWSKDQLAERILDHFYTREVGCSAIGQFMLFVKDRMRELMETYAPLIYSTSLEFNPLDNTNYTETYDGTTDGNSTTNSENNGSGLTISSDTPQGNINKADILQGKYATSTTSDEKEGHSTDSTVNKQSNKSTRSVKGNSGENMARMLQEYRRAIRAVNTEIVYELEPLFMGIY